MFCHKCGTKSIEGAIFCQKCGAELISDRSKTQATAEPMLLIKDKRTEQKQENVSSQKPMQKKSDSEAQEVCDRLISHSGRCSKIKKISTIERKNGLGSVITVLGSFYKYIYIPDAAPGKTSITWSLTWFLYLIYIPILICDALFLTFFFQDEYYIGLTIGCMIGCVVWFLFLLFSYKERKEIITYINETLDCEIKSPSKIFLIACYLLNFIGIGLCVVAIILGSENSTGASAELPDSSDVSIVEEIGENNTSSIVEFPLATSTEAMKLFAKWAEDHPLIGEYHLDLISDDEVDDEGNKVFLFSFSGAFNMSIRKSDGYMEYISKYGNASMDEWYDIYFGEEAQSNVYTGDPNDVSYHGQPLASFVGFGLEKLSSYFGEPIGGTHVDGSLYSGGEYVVYEGGVIFVLDGDAIAWILGPTSAIEINGVTLDKGREEIIELLGIPGIEENVFDDMTEEYAYYMTYYQEVTDLLIELPDADSKSTDFVISRVLGVDD